jgi:YHS domain-containing protein
MRYSVVLFFLVFTLTLAGHAQNKAEVRKQQFNTKGDLALQGYDPVAYFTQNKAVKGLEQHAYAEKGISYHFSSAENMEKFKENPEQYEPQYGGWCAYAMGLNGEKVGIDPNTFKITEGKLYLFYNKLFNNTLPDWNKEEATLKPQADHYWQQIIR